MIGLKQNKLLNYFGVRKPPTGDGVLVGDLVGIIERRAITVVFQPVVSLTDAAVIGYEALSRGPQGSPLERPDVLFAAAAEHDLVWELEYLCRNKALERARDIIATKMIFLNVDPQIIKDPRFQKGYTREMLHNLYIDTGNVIFEITEKTAINDYRAFRRILDNYVSQGYKIAIDDTGAGYSGLKTLAQTRPHYIKVDMELIRDIDKDYLKQAMLKALYDFSVATNSQIIAEGIETRAELATLIDIGIPYGQGYYLRRPGPQFADLSAELQAEIIELNWRKAASFHLPPRSVAVGEIACQAAGVSPELSIGEAVEYFAVSPHAQGLPVVAGDRPVGLLMKNKLEASLGGNYRQDVYLNRPVRLLMDRSPLIVERDTPLEVAARCALARNENDIYDHILVENNGKYGGTVSVKGILERLLKLSG